MRNRCKAAANFNAAAFNIFHAHVTGPIFFPPLPLTSHQAATSSSAPRKQGG
jgi:hypothetical protein